jgi:hypothetical protein
MKTLLIAFALMAYLAGIAMAGQPPNNPQPGPDPPKCAPASTPGCSGDAQGTGPHDDNSSDDDEGGGNN